MKKYVCVFCDERKTADTAYTIIDKIGICVDCFKTLDKTALAQPFEGRDNISYIMSPFEYTDKLRHVILQMKFNNCYSYAPLLSELMKEYLTSYDIWSNIDYLIPVPLHKSRIIERGYNQSELIAGSVSDFLGIPMRTDVLERIRATKRQSSLNKRERMANVKGAFKSLCDLSGKRVLLFDDICTTRSTLSACAAALLQANVKEVIALTLSMQIEDEVPIMTY